MFWVRLCTAVSYLALLTFTDLHSAVRVAPRLFLQAICATFSLEKLCLNPLCSRCSCALGTSRHLKQGK